MQKTNRMIMLISISLLVMDCIPLVAQVKNNTKLSPIPAQLRRQFVDRLNLYFGYKRERKYDQLYELLINEATKPTKEALIELQKEYRRMIVEHS